MIRLHIFLASAAALLLASVAAAQPVIRTANNGNLIMEDVPEIPAEIVESLNRYQNVRSASFRGLDRGWPGHIDLDTIRRCQPATSC